MYEDPRARKRLAGAGRWSVNPARETHLAPEAQLAGRPPMPRHGSQAFPPEA